MKFQKLNISGVDAQLSIFEKADCPTFVYSVLSFNDNVFDLKTCFEYLKIAFDNISEKYGCSPVFCGCKLSDSVNNYEAVKKFISNTLNCTADYVEQPPLSGGKIALIILWVSKVYFGNDGLNYFEFDGVKQYFTSHSGDVYDSYQSTHQLLDILNNDLLSRGGNIMDNCLRTWFYVRDIDYNYAGLIKSRESFFASCGMNKSGHFTASTGIGGRNAINNSSVTLTSRFATGLDSNKMKILYAAENMNRAADYGATFERGVLLNFDRYKEVLISGTASINNKGEILFVNDVALQCERTCNNIYELLKEAEFSETDIAQITVYLRDMSDFEVADIYFRGRYPLIPILITLAPVCRPGWLIEAEASAFK